MRVDMSSLPFSIGSQTPTKLSTTCIPKLLLCRNSRNQINVSSSSSSSSPRNLLKLNENSGSTSLNLGRREAIGVGLSFGFLDALLSLQPPVAAAEEAIPCEFTIATSGLAFCDKVVGTGPEAVKGQLIKAHYVGKLLSGKVFDSSYNRGKPLTFRIGVGEVIKGWDEGILGGDGVPPMLAGGKRTLKLPPELGYGMRGAGCRGGSCIIPPDSVLLFDVEFIGKA